jgi:hypothetical protein
VVTASFVFCAVGTNVSAQPLPGSGLPIPRLFTITPCGGKIGTSFEVTFTGQDIEEPSALLFSQPGIKAEPIVPVIPPADPKKPAPKPAPAPPVTRFKVTIPASTPLGIHDVRLVNKWGISNPRAFVVGELAELPEKEPNDDVPQAQRAELNTTINGVIASAADVDYFVFRALKGQRVLASCLASTIDSRLHAALEVYDSSGRELVSNRHYYNGDALADCTLPADGDYYVRLHEFTHAEGGPEYFYRLSISTAPWIDAIIPPMVEPGKPTSVTIYGRNLPGGKLDPTAIEDGCVLEKLTTTVNMPNDPIGLPRLAYSSHVPPQASAVDGFEYRMRNGAGMSNPFLLSYAWAPVVLDNEANDTPGTAQEIRVPCEISGRIEKRHDRDWYVFAAKKNDVYNIELFGDRLGAQADFYFLLKKADGKQDFVEADDDPDVLNPVKFNTRTGDPPVYRFTVPEDGKYQFLVSSREADMRAGPRQFYRVRITPPRPDFHLVLLPADDMNPDACCIRQGGQEHYTALIWRHDGWSGPVTITAAGLPSTITCQPQIIGPNIRQTSLVLSASPDAPAWTGEVRVKASGVINGRTIVREARPASITWAVQPNGTPAISRLDRNLVLAVRERAPFNLIAAADKTSVLQGSKVNVELKLARLWADFKAPLQITPIDPSVQFPPNVIFNNNQPLTMAPGKDEAKAVLDIQANAPPGTYNLVLRGTAQTAYSKDPMAKQKPNVNIVHPARPIVLTILPRQVASISVSNASPTIKLGNQAEIVVKVGRQHDYTGEFKVQLVVPASVKGLHCEGVTIPPGRDEVKLIVRVPAGAEPGNRANLVVRASAMLNGNVTLAHDAKISVNVIK